MNVAVMFGGRSVEHDVSIISAMQAIKHFDKSKYTVYPVYIARNNEFYYSDCLCELESFSDKERLLSNCTRIAFTKNEGIVSMIRFPLNGAEDNVICQLDVVFPIVHGTNVEDGILQGFLKTLDVPYSGCDVLSSAVGMDKYVLKVLLHSEGFPVLPGAAYSRHISPDIDSIVSDVARKFQFPLVVKPVNLGSSVGISKAENAVSLKESIESAFEFSTRILIEPAVVNIREINCSVMGNAKKCIASECEEPLTSHSILDFEEKYISGAAKTGASKGMASLKRKIPANIDHEIREQIRDISCRVFRYLECCGVVRLDYIIDTATNHIWLNEINTIPGSLAYYLWEAVGISYPQLIDELIRLTFERYNDEKLLNYNYESSILNRMREK